MTEERARKRTRYGTCIKNWTSSEKNALFDRTRCVSNTQFRHDGDTTQLPWIKCGLHGSGQYSNEMREDGTIMYRKSRNDRVNNRIEQVRQSGALVRVMVMSQTSEYDYGLCRVIASDGDTFHIRPSEAHKPDEAMQLTLTTPSVAGAGEIRNVKGQHGDVLIIEDTAHSRRNLYKNVHYDSVSETDKVQMLEQFFAPSDIMREKLTMSVANTPGHLHYSPDLFLIVRNTACGTIRSRVVIEVKPKRPKEEEWSMLEELHTVTGYDVLCLWGYFKNGLPYENEGAVYGKMWHDGRLLHEVVLMADDEHELPYFDERKNILDVRWKHPKLLAAYAHMREQPPPRYLRDCV